jgi:hypothetical protein
VGEEEPTAGSNSRLGLPYWDEQAARASAPCSPAVRPSARPQHLRHLASYCPIIATNPIGEAFERAAKYVSPPHRAARWPSYAINDGSTVSKG